MNVPERSWVTLGQFLEISCPWFTLVGEHLQNEKAEVLDYWRIEKPDSVIILPILNDHLVLPPPMYRPGLGKSTLDFPGGRVPAHRLPQDVIPEILQRELGLEPAYIKNLVSLNPKGLAVNSSFSNQKLYGFTADIDSSWDLTKTNQLVMYPNTSEGLFSLLDDLTCLQCRYVLLEWHLKSLMGIK
jgi:hypothetical protein